MTTKTCRETVDLLLAYLEDRLPPEDREALDQHFAGCPPCLAFVESYRQTPRIVRESTGVRLPDEVAQRLLQFLRSRVPEA